MKHIDVAPHFLGRAQQRGMAAGRVDALAQQGGLGIGAWAAAPPRSIRRPSRRSPRRRYRATALAEAHRRRLADRRCARPATRRASPLAANGVTSRTETQIAAEAASSTVSAVPNCANALPSAAARWATEAAIPSSRNSVTACLRSETGQRAYRRAATPSSADAPPPTHRMASRARPSSRDWPQYHQARAAPACARSRACGITFSVTSVMTASVPHDPASSLQRS